MANPSRSTPNHLTYLELGAARTRSLAPLALLRGAEARAPGLPRIGAARLPSHNVVDLAQAPTLAFPAATIATVTTRGGRARVEGHWLGLTGPMAPLPLHLTEFAAYERRYSRQHPYNGLLDVVAGRMLQLFYRAWASTSATSSSDRLDDDYAADRVAALSGAEDGAASGTAFPPRARLRYAALYLTPRSPVGIADALSDLMRLPVRVTELVPRWRDIVADDRTLLGARHAALGEAVAGGRVRTVADAFRVTVTAATRRDLADLLPSGRRYRLLEEAIAAFAPPHLEWDVEIEVAPAAMRPARLGGGARLGWTGWTGRHPRAARADVRLGAAARTIARMKTEERA